MDIVSELLSGIRSSGAVLHRTVLEPPWALRIAEEAPLSIALALSGEAVLVFDDGEQFSVTAGMAALIATTEHYVVADSSTTPVQIVVRPDGAHFADGTPVPPPDDLITCQFAEDGSTVLISGNYQVDGTATHRLVATLPRCTVVPMSQASVLLDFLTAELYHARPGQQASLDRWLDLALVNAVRAWLDESPNAPAWYAALADPMVGAALRAIHAAPAADWSIDKLAAVAAIGRSTLTDRFTTLVGESPMAYVVGVRLDHAADLLLDTDQTLAVIAEQVGYASPFSFSAAFKRHTGRSPAQFRKDRRSTA